MIPILYSASETAFSTNGLGRLSDAISCKVTEERNGSYELYLEYPVTGSLFDEIQKSSIILADAHQGGTTQPFRVYRIDKPINGICGIYAEHISYELVHIPVMPFTASGIALALAGLVTNAAQECPFTVWTDKTTAGTFRVSEPTSFRSLLGGVSGSILDTFGGGDYEFDRYAIKLHANRGADNGVTIRYGTNLVDLTQEENIENTVTGILPYWMDPDSGDIFTLPEKCVWSANAANFPYKRTAILDWSERWENQPTEAQLRAAAQAYVSRSGFGVPSVNLDVSFVPLYKVSEGADSKPVEVINLCDTVTVIFETLGVSANAKVIKTVWNVLLERYDSIEIGDSRHTLSDAVKGVVDDTTEEQQKEQRSSLQKYVDHQTALITGGLGGYVVINAGENEYPDEILIMDNPDRDLAVNVIRMNRNGIGFSTSGYQGPFSTAWTIDGVFNASVIGAGVMDADYIRAGTIADTQGQNYWNLDTGEFHLASYATKSDVDAIQIGGTNLIINTLVPDVSSAEKYPRLVGQTLNTACSTGVRTATTHGIRNTSSDARRPTIRFGANGTGATAGMQGLVAGRTYTLSFDAAWRVMSGSSQTTNTYVGVYVYEADTIAGSFVQTNRRYLATVTPAQFGTDMTARCEFTFTLKPTSQKLYILYSCNNTSNESYATGDYIELSNLKLEEGNKATSWSPAPEDSMAITDQLSAEATAMAASIVTINDEIVDIQAQLDGQLEAWFYHGAPTLSNAPAVDWTTEAKKQEHQGDTYTDLDTGYSYRFVYDSTWKWIAISDSVATEALALAQTAKDTADGKRRIFVVQPTPPYDVGDLWVQGANGDIMRCKTARASGSFSASHWILASKYTDDTAANAAQTTANQAIADITVVNGKISLIASDTELAEYTTGNTMNKRVATVEQTADGIQQTVSREYQRIENTEANNLIPYPYYDGSSKTTAGITFVANADGSVTATGTATSNAIYYFNYFTEADQSDALTLSEGTYVISGCPAGGGGSTYRLNVQKLSGGAFSLAARDSGDGSTVNTFTVSGEMLVRVYIYVFNGATLASVVFKPQLEFGAVAHPWRSPVASLASQTEALRSEIAQTADEILLDVSNTYATRNELSGYVTDTEMETALSVKADSATIAATYQEKSASPVVNLLPSTYWKENESGNPTTIAGIEWTVNNDGSVTAKGTAGSSDSIYRLSGYTLEQVVPVLTIDPDKRYTLSGCPSGGSASTYALCARTSVDGTPPTSASAGSLIRDFGDGVTTTTARKWISVYCTVYAGTALPEDGITFYPQLETGPDAHGYTSTHGGSVAVIERIRSAEAAITVQAGEISSKVSSTDYNGNTIASLINQNTTTVLVQASHIDLAGAVTIGDISTGLQENIVTSVVTRAQYRLSSSDTSLSGGSWSYTVPAWQAGYYLWTRNATTKTFIDGDTSTEYTTAVYDRNLTEAIATANNADSAVGSLSGTVDSLSDTVDSVSDNVDAVSGRVDTVSGTVDSLSGEVNTISDAVDSLSDTVDSISGTVDSLSNTVDATIAETVPVYYRSTVATKPTIDSTTTIGTAVNTDNVWTYAMPRPSRGKTFYTANRFLHSDGSISYSTVRVIENATYTSNWCSSNNSAYIDGGAIYAGSVLVGALSDDVKDDIVTNASTKTQYRLSASPDSLSGSYSWQDTVPAWLFGTYLWTRVATTKTYIDGHSTTSYSTAVYDKNLTDAISLSNDVDSAVDALTPKVNASVVAVVPVYYRSTTTTTPSISSSTSIGTSATTDNVWTYVMPRPKNGCTFFITNRLVSSDGSISFSDVRKLENATYTSKWCSSSNAAYIDGGAIYANSVTAAQLAANVLTAENIKLYGKMSVYKDGSSFADANRGGYVGYMSGQSWSGEETNGVALMADSNHVIATSLGVRMTHIDQTDSSKNSEIYCADGVVTAIGNQTNIYQKLSVYMINNNVTSPTGEIQCGKIGLYGGAGRRQVFISTDYEYGGEITLYDGAGTDMRAYIGYTTGREHHGLISVYDKDGVERIQIQAMDPDNMVAPILDVKRDDGRTGVRLSHNSYGGVFRLYGSNSPRIVMNTSSGDDGVFTMYNSQSRYTFQVSAASTSSGISLFETSSTTPTRRVFVGVTQSGNGVLQLTDSTGTSALLTRALIQKLIEL